MSDVWNKLHQLPAPPRADSSIQMQLLAPKETDNLHNLNADLVATAESDSRTPEWELETPSPENVWTENVLIDLKHDLEALRDHELASTMTSSPSHHRQHGFKRSRSLTLSSRSSPRSSGVEKRYRPSGFMGSRGKRFTPGFMGSRGKRFMPGLESLLLAKYYRGK